MIAKTLVVVVILGALLGLGVRVGQLPQYNPFMPLVWEMGMEVVERIPLRPCDDGTVIVRFTLAPDNDDDLVTYAYFLLDDFKNDARAHPRPFAVLTYPDNEHAYIRADLNRNGVVDSRGLIGAPGIGVSPCDTWMGRRG